MKRWDWQAIWGLSILFLGVAVFVFCIVMASYAPTAATIDPCP